MYEKHSVSYSNISHYYNLHKNSGRKAWIIIPFNLFFFCIIEANLSTIVQVIK